MAAEIGRLPPPSRPLRNRSSVGSAQISVGHHEEMKAPEDPVGSVAAVLERHGSALRGLFSRYCDGSPTWPLAKRRLHQDQFLRFARDFKLCPGLMPRVELLQLCRGVQGPAKPVVVAPDTARPLLSYDEFVNWVYEDDEEVEECMSFSISRIFWEYF